MQSSLIGKIEKAKRYAEEPNRVNMLGFVAGFKGDNNDYTVSLENNKWHCNCNFFKGAGICSHTMALQKILSPMLAEEAKTSPIK